MKKLKYKLSIAILILPLFVLKLSYADGMADKEIGYIQNKINTLIAESATRLVCFSKQRCSLALTTQFYLQQKNTLIWTNGQDSLPIAKEMYLVLQNSYQDGLNPLDYHVEALQSLLKQINNSVINSAERFALLADFELTLSDAFLLYAKHMGIGRIDTRINYPKWTISKRSFNLLQLLTTVATSQKLNPTLSELVPKYSGYAKLKVKLNDLQQIAENGGWESIPVGASLKLGSKGKAVLLLQERLLLGGELLHINSKKIFDNETFDAVKQFQKENNLAKTGIVDKKTLRALNIPATERIRQISINMDRLRWLPEEMGTRYILVNIPDFSLVVKEDSDSVLSMPVIVGKEANRSCVLSSKINYLELNPYWLIPDSIARKEVLPKLQENPNYLTQKKIRAYDANMLEINPAHINWKTLTPVMKTYKFRQQPGNENALGHVKFIFPNDCGIYLHDTPTRNLFGRNRRDFSHGCIRIGKPIELADYLLSDKPNWNKARIDAQISLGKRQVVTLNSPIDIHILYATSWVDDDGYLQFRNDIYNIDKIPYPVYLPEANLDKLKNDIKDLVAQ